MAIRKRTVKREVDTSELDRWIAGALKRSRDVRPPLRHMQRELVKAHDRLFQTDGAPVGGWAPLKSSTFAEKLSQGYSGGTLVRTGDLENSLTQLTNPMGIRDLGPKSMGFGTRVQYAQFHQTGTRNMHERQVVYVPRTFARETGGRVAKHIVEGTVPTTKEAKGLFNVI